MDRQEAPAPRPPAAHGTVSADAALAHGIAFLRDRQDARGRWLDYDDAGPGPSTEWTTALVGTALARTGEPAGLLAARRAWRWLRARRPLTGGWGWSALFPRDADSTAWGLLLAEALDERGLAWARARRVLAAHVDEQGGVSTFHARALRPFRVALGYESVEGWTAAHGCVTALAASVPGVAPRVKDALRARQDAQGGWPAYWWPSDEYSTALAAEALAPENERAGDLLASRIGPSGAVAVDGEPSAFATAWAARGLVACRRAKEAALAAEWLEGEQRADGSWAPSAWMRIVPPDVVDPAQVERWERGLGAPGGAIVDTRAHVTTASVVGALSALARAPR